MRRPVITALAFAIAADLFALGCSFEGGDRVSQTDDAGTTDGADDPDVALPADQDGDGFEDTVDNCPTVANPGQANEDGDLHGDVCDNCPHVDNDDQADLLEVPESRLPDGIGDACDPNPDDDRDVLALFLPFNDPAEVANWSAAGSQNFFVEDGLLKQDVNTDLGLIWINDLNLPDASWVTKLTYRNVSTTDQFRGAGVIARFERDQSFGSGIGCGEMQDTNFQGGTPFLMSTLWNGSGFSQGAHGDTQVTDGRVSTYHARAFDSVEVECSREESSENWSRTANDRPGTGVALATWSTGADFEFLIGYAVVE